MVSRGGVDPALGDWGDPTPEQPDDLHAMITETWHALAVLADRIHRDQERRAKAEAEAAALSDRVEALGDHVDAMAALLRHHVRGER